MRDDDLFRFGGAFVVFFALADFDFELVFEADSSFSTSPQTPLSSETRSGSSIIPGDDSFPGTIQPELLEGTSYVVGWCD